MSKTSTNPLNQGWFIVYRVVAVIYAIALIALSFENLSKYPGALWAYLYIVFGPLIIAGLIGIEMIAMHRRDLKKAQLCLLAFLIYAGINAGLIIYVAISPAASFSDKMLTLIKASVNLACYCACVIYGAFHVYKALKPAGTANSDLYKGILGV